MEVSAAAHDGAGGRCNVGRTRPGRSGDAGRRRSAGDRDTRGAACPHGAPRKNLPGVTGPKSCSPRAVAGEDLIECRGELAVSVADQEPEAACPVTEIHEQVAGLLGGPGSGGVGPYRDITPIVGACRRPSMLAGCAGTCGVSWP